MGNLPSLEKHGIDGIDPVDATEVVKSIRTIQRFLSRPEITDTLLVKLLSSVTEDRGFCDDRTKEKSRSPHTPEKHSSEAKDSGNVGISAEDLIDDVSECVEVIPVSSQGQTSLVNVLHTSSISSSVDALQALFDNRQVHELVGQSEPSTSADYNHLPIKMDVDMKPFVRNPSPMPTPTSIPVSLSLQIPSTSTTPPTTPANPKVNLIAHIPQKWPAIGLKGSQSIHRTLMFKIPNTKLCHIFHRKSKSSGGIERYACSHCRQKKKSEPGKFGDFHVNSISAYGDWFLDDPSKISHICKPIHQDQVMSRRNRYVVDSGGSTISAKSDGKSKNRNRRRGVQNQPDHGTQLPGPPMPSYLPITQLNQQNGGIAHPNPGFSYLNTPPSHFDIDAHASPNDMLLYSTLRQAHQ
ncbi:hypothetical protein WR25_01276 [Diploscapter pachys]|uniref:Uncharacterized protein n=1 Tax=Diploscapter pachys TaxID=2018661 RepID=A0A2A2LXU5_9BILA|nr:hypothetical protein WR25_01276 [Diploscapter pachys]